MTNLQINELRDRLSKMKDRDLQNFTIAMEFLTSPKANSVSPPSNNFVFQLEKARVEALRRVAQRVLKEN
jgi:hypothetical protein